MTPTLPPDVLWFRELGLGDVPRVGGKNASLGEMVRALTPRGVRVPDGFAITADAYRRFLREGGLEERIATMLDGLDTHDVKALQACGRAIRDAVVAAPLPPSLVEATLEAYRELSAGLPGGVDVAVRSSATAEDLPDASFAGQQETFLNVRGESALLDTVRRCFASLFTDRAISYRVHQGFDQTKVALSVGVQRMVRSDLASAGVMFSIDTETGFRDVVLINAAYGLGENVVQGAVNPDEYVVFKPTLEAGCRPILHKSLGQKELQMVYDEGGTRMVKNLPVPAEARARFALSDEDILTLARWAVIVERHYSEARGVPTPMDMEWARDGRTGELFLVQARPETVRSRESGTSVERHVLDAQGPVLVTGRAVGQRIGSGPVRVVNSAGEMHLVKPGDVLVTDKTDPDWEPVMKRAAAIVTNRGGRTCHAAIVSRELGLPAIVGTEVGTERLRDGSPVTVSCAEGDQGRVYEGTLGFHVEKLELGALARPRTKIMMNVADPTEAFRLGRLPSDGVGLAREEFIINHFVPIHPMALLGYATLEDRVAKARIDELTHGALDKPGFFVDKLAEGIAMIGAAFYPRDVIVRLSDFKTNEYANLVGGRAFEPVEENPMLGFRGASRYYHPRYRDGFALECAALLKVRKTMGLTNVKVMVPFCRTVEEGEKVIAAMAAHGLVQHRDGLEIYVMCEIPSNVLLADAFADVFDGFSIGSNDLTQLVLGVDRDSEIVAPLFDERNPAVMKMVASVIAAAKKKNRKIGICGQAPSDHPEFARFLVREGIDSISLNPDVVLQTTLDVLGYERELGG